MKSPKRTDPGSAARALPWPRCKRAACSVPEAICISTEAYQEYVSSTGLRDQMHMELYRKPFEEMRWEEIWDTALRIRNMFIKTPLPSELQETTEGPPRLSVFRAAGLSQVLGPRRRLFKDILRRSPRILCQYPRPGIHSGAHQARVGFPVV